MRRRLVLVLSVLAVVAVACGSDGGSADPAGPTPDAVTAPTGASGPGSATAASGSSGTVASAIPDACDLITADDASIALGADVEVVPDPFGSGFLQGDPAEFATVCAYRPVGSTDERAVAVGIAAPGSITPEEFAALTEGGITLGGPGDEGYAVEGGVVFRSGDLIVGVAVTTGEGPDTDGALALELAGLVADGLPAPAPDPANLACTLLTEAAAEEAFGVDLAFGSDAIVDEQRSGCGFREVGGPVFVSLRMTQGADAATDFDGAFELASDQDGFRELDGLGDRAFVRADGGAVDVVVLVGDTVLGTNSFSPERELTEETIALATAMAASL